MTKHLILTLIALVSLCMETSAQVSGLALGYCDGQSTTNGSLTSADKNVWLSAAIYIPAGQINTYSGNHIDSIRVALASRLNIDTLTVWLRNDLNGENLVEGTITKDTDTKIAKGWNAVALDTPYNIEKSQTGLYIGYSFYQKGASFGIAALPTKNANAFFAQLPGEDWADYSNEGTLCIEGLVFGDALPKVNVQLLEANVQDTYVIEKGELSISGIVKNLATQTITGFDVMASIDGVDETYTAHVDASLPYKQQMDFNITVNPNISEVGDGQGHVRISIINLAEGDDEDPSDNVLDDTFAIVQNDFSRKILIEEFTTEQCSNCPRMASYLHDILEKDEYKDNVLVACHHSGYYTDWLTSTCDNSYLWFFNAGGSTYAPAIMIDRSNYGGSTPVICPSSQSELEQYIDYSLAQPAFVSVNVSVERDNDNPQLLHITVEGAKSVETLCNNPRIVVYALEDDIAARSQAGASDFTHNHVKRAFNSTWGDVFSFDGDSYEYTCDLEISSSCITDNMQVVAFIYNYNDEDATDCAVANSGSALIPHVETGIQTVSTSHQTEYFTLSGRKVAASDLHHGLYLVKQDGQTSKIIVP